MKNRTQPFMAVQILMLRTLMIFLLFAGFAFQFPLSQAIAEKSPDEILAGAHRNFPPQYSVDEATGKPAGFAIDTMNEIARRAGLTVRYTLFDDWPAIDRALKEGRIDIIPNIGIVEERKTDMDFTSPVETYNISIFVRNTTTDIHGIDDMQGRKVAVVSYNAGLFLIQKFGKATPVIFKSLDEALLSLLSGNTDALVYPEPPVLLIAHKSKLSERIKTVGKPLQEVKRAIAVGKERTDLLYKLDAAVKEFISTPDYRKMYSTWYGGPDPYWDVRRVLIVTGSILVFVIVMFAVWHYLSLMRLNRDLKYSIEEQKKAEEMLKKSETRFREMFDDAPVGYHELDTEGRVIRVNRTELTTLGYSAEEMLGRHVWEFIDEKDISRKAVLGKLAGTLPSGRDLERTYCKKDGTRIPVLVQDLLLREKDGKIIGIRSTLQDITKGKQAEQEKRSPNCLK